MDHAVFVKADFCVVLVKPNSRLFVAFVVGCWRVPAGMDFCFEISRASVFAFWEEGRLMDLAVSGRLVVRMDVTMLGCALLTACHSGCLLNVNGFQSLTARAGSCAGVHHGDAGLRQAWR